MKRLLTSAAAAALMVAGTGSVAQSQVASSPLFDFGLYGGLGFSTQWFEINEKGHRIGFAPMTGAAATFWASPNFGVRLHGAYMPSGFPEPDDASIGETNSQYPLNNYFVDLNLVFRPFTSGLGFLGAPYMFVGGGAEVTNVAGDRSGGRDVYTCVRFYYPGGVCLSEQPGYATVGQGVVGLGWDFMPIANTIGLFAEAAVHGYDSPAHVFNTARAEDKFAFTPSAKLGLKFAFGGAEAAPVVLPPPPPAPAPPPPPPATSPIRVCVVQNGQLVDVEAQFNPATGDTTVMGGQRFSMAHPATAPSYAASETWFINNDSVTFNNQTYVRFGTTRIITPTQLTSAGTVTNGVGVFTETGATTPADVIYVPVRPGCEFQPYQRRERVRVRG